MQLTVASGEIVGVPSWEVLRFPDADVGFELITMLARILSGRVRTRSRKRLVTFFINLEGCFMSFLCLGNR